MQNVLKIEIDGKMNENVSLRDWKAVSILPYSDYMHNSIDVTA